MDDRVRNGSPGLEGRIVPPRGARRRRLTGCRQVVEEFQVVFQCSANPLRRRRSRRRSENSDGRTRVMAWPGLQQLDFRPHVHRVHR